VTGVSLSVGVGLICALLSALGTNLAFMFAAAVTASVITSGVMGGWTSWRRRSCSRRSALGVMVRPRQPPAGPVELGVNHEILHHEQLIV
jgi:hypothetical protein